MTLFAYLGIPLWYAFLYSRYNFSSYPARFVRGSLFIGGLWFGCWLFLRILFPAIFTPKLESVSIYLQAGIVQTIIPVLVMLLWMFFHYREELNQHRSNILFPVAVGMFTVFFFLNNLLDLLVFPFPGILSRSFFLPIYRMVMIFIPSLIIKKWFTWSAFYRYSLLGLGVGVALLGPIPVMLEFMRYEGAGVVSVSFILGTTLLSIELRSLVPKVGNPIRNAFQHLSQTLRNKWNIIFGRL